METVLGLALIYTWVHSIVIVATKVENTSTYEKVVLLLGVTGVGLFVIGSV